MVFLHIASSRVHRRFWTRREYLRRECSCRESDCPTRVTALIQIRDCRSLQDFRAALEQLVARKPSKDSLRYEREAYVHITYWRNYLGDLETMRSLTRPRGRKFVRALQAFVADRSLDVLWDDLKKSESDLENRNYQQHYRWLWEQLPDCGKIQIDR